MTKRRLLITGAQGFVGRAVMDRVASHYPDGFDPVDFIDPETHLRPDIRDAAAVERAIDRAQADAVLHLAAIAAPRQAQKDQSQAWMVNVLGTLHVATAMRRRTPAARLIWSGSSEAYGNAFNRYAEPILEEAALEPMSAYGATKAAADIMLRQMVQDGFDVVVFRPFNHTGPQQTPDYVVPAFARQVARIEKGLQEPVLQVGNLAARRDFLHVQDVAEAYLLAARSSAPARHCYNISTGRPVSIESLLNGLLARSNSKITVAVDPARYVANTVETASGDPSALQADLVWSASFSLDETLQAVLDAQRAALEAVDA
ncbi:NAD-dependent epimerase/dehydratase family protein [Rhizobium sp. SSA_523]|uniref:NAD-dependent epimerase/dehydratase family protein n=1 Tax=Rhizobium sp. SSA_523 TaxID=2952477 RepID=UPI002090F2B1|nr:NAD-dependent epimerase/dehydratase family protein [Rhizobium sp. SSA_523]MCO5734706.1 GDP-mannose 4,6-dehydratase [Rhizobium sp. SSA_523]WKC20968.1 GDP-mannose 4,6-dehydratase [Rhizobium sp. SSA_523]